MICPNCRKDISDDSRFCRFCGAEFIDDEPDAAEQESVRQTTYSITPEGAETPQKKSFDVKKLVAPFIVLVVLVVVGTLIGVVIKSVSGAGELVTDASGEAVHKGLGWGTVDMDVVDADGTTRTVTAYRSLITSEDILAEYTEIMNKLKTDAPAFSYIRYQNLPTDYQNIGSVAAFVLPIIEQTVTSKEAAKSLQYAAGNADKLPVVNSQSGCLLTDATKIKRAYSEALDNDRCRLVITLADETNPSSSTASGGAIASVFDPYDAAEKITAISNLAKNNIDFSYNDCTVSVVYDMQTRQVESVTQVMNIDITAGAYIAELKARIVDTVEYTDFIY